MTPEMLERQVKAGDGVAQGTAAKMGQSAVPVLARLSADPSPQVRNLALVCLNIVGGPTTSKVAMDHVDDQDINVVSTAIQILHRFPPKGADARLRELYLGSDDAFVRAQMPLIAGRLGAEANANEWAKLWTRDGQGDIHEGLTVGLARMGYSPAREEFVKALQASRGYESRKWIDHAVYMENKWVLPALGTMLERLEPAYDISPDFNPRYLRTADLAVIAIAKLGAKDFSFSATLGVQFSSAQIAEVRSYVSGLPK